MDKFTFDNIAGRPASLEINDRGNHMVVTWGDLTVTDLSGHVGFWETFRNNPAYWASGAARESAMRKHARETIEAEIYMQLQFAKQAQS